MPPHRSVRSARTIVAVLIVSVFALGSASNANAAPVACGDTISASVTLTADLVCSGNGVAVFVTNNNAITINLNGHSITGPGAVTNSIGIAVIGGLFSQGPLIENGTIREFGTGMEVAMDLVAQTYNLRVAHNGLGIRQNSGTLTVRSSYINENVGDGIQGSVCAFYVFASQIAGNGGNGITAHECFIQAAGNVVTGNHGYGILNEEFGVDLRNNQVNNNGFDGILLDRNDFLDGYTLLDNSANRNGGHGIVFQAHILDGRVYPPDHFEGNIARDNRTPPQCVNIFCRTS
jgi:hypothetical protein